MLSIMLKKIGMMLLTAPLLIIAAAVSIWSFTNLVVEFKTKQWLKAFLYLLAFSISTGLFLTALGSVPIIFA